jgi:hypothetical protein
MQNPALACIVLKTVKARLAKMKRKEFKNPPAALLGALSSAFRSTCQAGGNLAPAAEVGPNGQGGR